MLSKKAGKSACRAYFLRGFGVWNLERVKGFICLANSMSPIILLLLIFQRGIHNASCAVGDTGECGASFLDI